jgi:hypothetical protein
VLITGRVVEIYNGNEVASYPICHVATFCGRVYPFIITSDLLVTVVDTSLCFLMNQLFVFFLAFRLRDLFLILFESPYHIFTKKKKNHIPELSLN